MDIVLKNVPEEITEAKVKEWVGVLIERYFNQKLSPPVAEVEKAKTDIDAFRTANSLAAKFEAKPVVPETKLEKA